jgi:hypothetical protein
MAGYEKGAVFTTTGVAELRITVRLTSTCP